MAHDFDGPKNRLLSLDGGGIRALFTLEILDRVEAILRERSGKKDFVLADYFNFIGGTSTGAIVAAGLSWGLKVEEIRDYYAKFAHHIFRPLRSWRTIRHAFDRKAIAGFLQEIFTDESGQTATLGSDRLKTLLMLVMRNGSSGSVWPITNSPGAKYNNRSHDSCNLEYPLWKLVRASTAAPTYFPTETIRVKVKGHEEVLQEFIDGAVSPYNNPALRMYAQATVPELGVGMASGTDNMYLLSIGTGRVKHTYEYGKLGNINRLGTAIRTITAVMDSAQVEQDTMCRVVGQCLHGEKIDSEIGDLLSSQSDVEKRFLYCRYDHEFTKEEQERSREASGSGKAFDLADLKSMDLLSEIGRQYAEETVLPEHLPEAGDGLGRAVLKPDGEVSPPAARA
ncbi:MAG: patatin-like phospholipase family protein [Verrucomicrobiota bacterium]